MITGFWSMLPIGSMYGIYANIWGILMVNVTIYSSTMDPMGYSTCIATSYGIQSDFFPHPSADARRHIPSICAIKRYQKILCYSSYSHPSHFKGILNIKYSLLNNYIYIDISYINLNYIPMDWWLTIQALSNSPKIPWVHNWHYILVLDSI